jgi:hypothetical protein
MLVGGWGLAASIGIEDGFSVLTQDLFYPTPERLRTRTRALVLVAIYAFGIASEVVWRASRPMKESSDIPRAMTASVILATLWIVGWELATAIWLFQTSPAPTP